MLSAAVSLQESLSAHLLLYFPGCLGDTQFSFRLRQSVGRRALGRRDDVYNRDAPITLQVWEPIDRLLIS